MLKTVPLLLLSLLSFACLDPEGPTEKTENLSPFQSEMLTLVNAIRAEGCDCGDEYFPPVAPLSWDFQLTEAAQVHADDLQTHNVLTHEGSDGSSHSERISRAGYDWQTTGENIAWNARDVANAVQLWKNSPGHCKNMMNARFTELGAAQAGAYMVQVFARPF